MESLPLKTDKGANVKLLKAVTEPFTQYVVKVGAENLRKRVALRLIDIRVSNVD